MNKKLVTFRLSNEDLEKLDYLKSKLTDENKINFNQTSTIEYLIRWEYDKKYNTNKSKEYLDSLKNN